MNQKTLTISIGLATLSLACGCASFTPPKMTMPKAPVLKMPQMPKVSSLNPFSKKPQVEAPAITHQTPQSATTNRGFQFSNPANSLNDGPGVRAMLLGNAPDDNKARASFAVAQQLYQQAQSATGEQRKKLFNEAGPHYARAAERFADASLKEDAYFLSGESYFFADEYPDAIESFGGLIKNYPSTRYMDVVDGRRFKIAEYWINIEKEDSKYSVLPNFVNGRRPVVDTYGNAIKLYDKIRYDNPNGKLADDATMAAAAAHFERKKHGEANDLFDDLRKNFPSSEHQFQAHLLGLKTKLQVYEGPDYDGTVLNEAQEIVKRMRIVFPKESKEHQEYLVNALKEVRLKMAEREFSIAKFYDNRGEYGAAKVYYGRVRREYNDTNLGVESEKRMAQIESYPESSEGSMDWLTNAFPKEHDPQPLLARDSPATAFK